jgi:hypothetical protein
MRSRVSDSGATPAQINAMLLFLGLLVTVGIIVVANLARPGSQQPQPAPTSTAQSSATPPASRTTTPGAKPSPGATSTPSRPSTSVAAGPGKAAAPTGKGQTQPPAKGGAGGAPAGAGKATAVAFAAGSGSGDVSFESPTGFSSLSFTARAGRSEGGNDLGTIVLRTPKGGSLKAEVRLAVAADGNLYMAAAIVGRQGVTARGDWVYVLADEGWTPDHNQVWVAVTSAGKAIDLAEHRYHPAQEWRVTRGRLEVSEGGVASALIPRTR